jgi:uncharacterized protein YdaU (DUF1376 family)
MLQAFAIVETSMSGEQSSELKINLWMPFDIGPFLQDTAHLSTEEIGAYTLLLLYYWAHGPLLNDPKRLQNIAKMPLDAWSIAYASLSMFFFVGSDGLLHQKGADRRRAKWLDKRLKAREKAIKAANARWSKRKAKPDSPSNAPSMPEAMHEEMLEQCPTSVVLSTKASLTPTPSLKTRDGDGSKNSPTRRRSPRQLGTSPRQLGISKRKIKAKQAQTARQGVGTPLRDGNAHASPEKRSTGPGEGGAEAFNSGSELKNAGSAAENPESVNRAKFSGESKTEVLRFWAGAGVEEFECPWSDLEDRALKDFVNANPKVDLLRFKQLLRNRAASEGINRADPPHKWLRSLVKYADGPLDRYGKPLRPARIH